MTWKRLIAVFLLLIVAEGALRKWVLTSYADVLYFAKDVTLLGAVLLFVQNNRVGLPVVLRRTSVPVVLGIYVFWVLLNVFNPRSPGPMVGIFGARAYLLYASLIIMLPVLARDWGENSWRRIFLAYALLIAVPVFALGAYQYFQPPGHWINRYAQEADQIAVAAGTARITGPFPYVTGMSTFVIANIGVGVGLVIGGLQSRRRLVGWLGVGLLGMGAVVGPMTGSRSVLLLSLLPLPLLAFRVFQLRLLRPKAIIWATAAAALVLGLSQTRLSGGWESLRERFEQAGDTDSRIANAYLDPVNKVRLVGLIGYGTGSAHQASPRLVPRRVPYDWLPDVYFEGEKGRVVLELGAIGLALYLAVLGRLCLLSYAVIRRARVPHEWVIGSSAFFIQLVAIPALGTVFNPTAGAIYWLLTGLSVAVWCRQEEGLRSSGRLPLFQTRALVRA